MDIQKNDQNQVDSNPFSSLFEKQRTPNKKGKWADEIDRFKAEDMLDMMQDPLLWWKLNQNKYPGLGTCLHFNFFFFLTL